MSARMMANKKLRRSAGAARTMLLACVVSLALATLSSPATARDLSAHAACSHQSGPGLIGVELLNRDGWTTEEQNELLRLLDRFARRICPRSEYIAINEASYYMKQVDGETVWQDTFQIKAIPPESDVTPSYRDRQYGVTVDFPNLQQMTVTVRASSGRVLYRSGMVDVRGVR
jgi:hypothetical protein